MPTGRPTKYTKEIIELARAYVDGGYEEVGDLFPSHVGIALACNLAKSTTYEWANDPDKQEFSDIFAKCMILQEKALVNNALLGSYNSTIAKVMLTKHGYSDKVQQEITGADGSDLKIKVVYD